MKTLKNQPEKRSMLLSEAWRRVGHLAILERVFPHTGISAARWYELMRRNRPVRAIDARRIDRAIAGHIRSMQAIRKEIQRAAARAK